MHCYRARMGHRERLMVGARRCLEERGYARTTSRDVAAAAEAPLGAVNYHFGSKDELLNAALLEVLDEWGTGLTSPAAVPSGATPGGAAHLESVWSQVIESVSSDRPMLVAALEALAQAERSPEIRDRIADAFEAARPVLAAQLHGPDGGDDPDDVRAASSVHMALIAGLTQQWLVDPEHAPTAADVARGLRLVAERLEAAPS